MYSEASYLEMNRILEAMKKLDPKSDQYGVLLGRYKALCAIHINLEKSNFEQEKAKADKAHRDLQYRNQIEKEQREMEFREKEFDYRKEKDVDDYNARVDFENNRVTLEQQKMDIEREKIEVEKERIKNERSKIDTDKAKVASDSVTSVAKTVGDIVQTSIKVTGAIATTEVGAKVLLVMARSVLSDEQKGNLVFSKVLGYIPKPNLFNFKVF